MKDLKEVIAANISALRQSAKMSQSALAEVLNYTDKAVSKWERAESLPDVTVLRELAAYFGVTVDYLLEEEHKESNTEADGKVEGKEKTNRVIITLLASALVWLVATFLFVMFEAFPYEGHFAPWLFYLYALPVNAVVLIVFNAIWGKRKWGFVIVSVLIWSSLVCLYLSLLILGGHNVWPLFILGIPAQAIVILWSGLHVKNK